MYASFLKIVRASLGLPTLQVGPRFRAPYIWSFLLCRPI